MNRDSNPMLTGIGGFRIDSDTADWRGKRRLDSWNKRK